MAKWKRNGARWWKFDFHTHTPASSDFGKGHDQPHVPACTPGEWLLSYMAAGADCVAITDHDTAGWVDRLKEALKELEEENSGTCRTLHLFPGMEITVHGAIHLLAILEPSSSAADLDAVRGAAGLEATPGGSDGVTRGSFGEVVDAVVSAGGIAIPSHVDRVYGLFEQPAAALEQALSCENIFAMELLNPASRKPQLYLDKKLAWTEVLGSDAHHCTRHVGERYPGSHFTWVRMGSPSLAGLRLALLDVPLSVARSDQETGDPNRYAPRVLE